MKQNDAREQALVRQAQQELPYVTDAFETLMRAYERRLIGTCRRLLGDAAEAEDAYQEVLIRLFRALPGFEFRSSFSTWLFRIARNECLDRVARHAREREVLRQLAPTEPRVAPPARYAGDIDRLLGRLKFSEREILALRYVSDLSLNDLARVLGISLSAAKMRLYRAVDHLQLLLDADGRGAEGGEDERG